MPCDDFPTVSSCETMYLECTKLTTEALAVCCRWEDHTKYHLQILTNISDVKKTSVQKKYEEPIKALWVCSSRSSLVVNLKCS